MWYLGAKLAMGGALAMGPAAPSATPETTGPAVGVLPLTLEGEHEPGAEKKLAEGLVDGIGRGGGRVVPPQEMREHAPDGCADAACLKSVAEKAELTHVVSATVSVIERDYTIELQLANARGKRVATLTENCDICGIDEVQALVADLAAGMQSKLETLERSAPVLNVTAIPEGAEVYVDDELVGTTPFTGEVPEGRHVIRVEADGFIPRTKRINGVEGTREDLTFELERIPEGETPEYRRRRKAMIGVGATSLGLGLAMAGAGIPLILIDGNENENRCSGNDVDVNGTCRYSFDTMAGGLSLAAGGAVLAAVGIGLLARARVERKNLEAQAFIGPRGIAIVGRF